VNTNESLILVDAFKEDVPPVVIPKKNEAGMTLGACLSSDAKWVLSGTDENELAVYDKSTGALCTTLTGHVAPIGCVKCNPRYDMWASGCVNTALWLRGGAVAKD
jgi:WD40 repeat protein